MAVVRSHHSDGYVIERKINGEEAEYNNISHWKWQQLLDFFNGDDVPHKSWLASTRGELRAILDDATFRKADRIQLLEVKMGRQDAPRALLAQAKMVSVA